MKIKLLRVDERLLHGQIIMKWAQYTECKKIYIVEDAVANDTIMKSILEMSFVQEYDCRIMTEEQLLQLQETEDEVFIIVKSISTAYRLIEKGFIPERVNVGTLTYQLGKVKYDDHIYMTVEEVNELRYIQKKAEVFYQAVPDGEQKMLTEDK